MLVRVRARSGVVWRQPVAAVRSKDATIEAVGIGKRLTMRVKVGGSLGATHRISVVLGNDAG